MSQCTLRQQHTQQHKKEAANLTHEQVCLVLWGHFSHSRKISWSIAGRTRSLKQSGPLVQTQLPLVETGAASWAANAWRLVREKPTTQGGTTAGKNINKLKKKVKCCRYDTHTTPHGPQNKKGKLFVRCLTRVGARDKVDDSSSAGSFQPSNVAQNVNVDWLPH